MKAIIYFLCICICYGFKCSPGCIGECEADYTCRSGCSSNYFNDTSCLNCKWDKSYDSILEAHIPNGTECMHSNKVMEKNGWLPASLSKITEIKPSETITFHFGEESDVDISFCYQAQQYRLAKWFKFNSTEYENGDYAFIQIVEETNIPVHLSLDITNSGPQEKFINCYASLFLNEASPNITAKISVVAKNESVDDPWYYIFVGLEKFADVNVQISLTKSHGTSNEPYYVLDQQIADYLVEDLSRTITIDFPVQSQGFYATPTCAKNFIVKMMLFRIKFKGNFSIFIDGTSLDRVNYLQEYLVTGGEGLEITKECKQLWVGKPNGVNTDKDKNGFAVRIQSETDESGDAKERYFAVLTEDQKTDIKVVFSAICPNNCHQLNQKGYCVAIEKKCTCANGYGGDDCHLKCYHDGKWQVDDHSKLCYFGSAHCSQWCGCEEGYELINNYCVSKTCASGEIGSGDECYQGSEGCLINCQCQSEFGWVKGKEGKCVNSLCGNGVINDLYGVNGLIRKEECDNGTNCNQYCRCLEGYIPDEDDPTSCVKKNISAGAIAGIAVGSSLGLIVIIVTLVIIVFLITRYKRTDVNIYKQQQPNYYYYIHGSVNTPPTKQARYDMTPLDLDYGNRNAATTIKDTRFERIEVKNFSRNKWMMIIFHTPNNPKYVFHFDPQVALIRPHSTPKLITSYMTLHCTTKIRDMKIPYTVWFSKSKSVLESISSLLKDKSFENWNQDDQNRMDRLCKSVRKHYHHSLVITTDSASSTHIDMDELNMSENPIAEGAMGRVFIGSYRSVPVAIKQFRWENLNEEEMKDLKKEVICECEIMSKLRNPYIANYMGSVTYIPQVSMVIQFFVLGSLGEYLRKDKEDYVKLPYKLKIRMLFDTARGMQFLHENRIMHLDLKPDNLLVNSLYTDSACCIKITDFGTSRFTKKTNKSGDKGLGTPIYVAPESYHDVYSFAGDVYSFGITAWEMFYQEEPYKGFKTLFEIKNHVESGKRLNIDEGMPVLLKAMIQDCWKNDPQERPTFDQISKSIVKIDDDISNHIDLDVNVSDGKIEELINKRTQRMQKQLSGLSHE